MNTNCPLKQLTEVHSQYQISPHFPCTALKSFSFLWKRAPISDFCWCYFYHLSDLVISNQAEQYLGVQWLSLLLCLQIGQGHAYRPLRFGNFPVLTPFIIMILFKVPQPNQFWFDEKKWGERRLMLGVDGKWPSLRYFRNAPNKCPDTPVHPRWTSLKSAHLWLSFDYPYLEGSWEKVLNFCQRLPIPKYS